MQLTQSDVQSETWRKLKAHYEDRLTKLRIANDSRQSIEYTEFLRGQIQECKNLLDLEPKA